MPEQELEKLLGGFAADTLTPEEKQALYRAALQDQELFNALADEQALKELLADPAVRRRLLQMLNQTGSAGAGGALSWLDWFRRPANLALAGGLAVAVFAVVLGTKVYQGSLKQAAHSVATEETKSTAPPAPAAAPAMSQPASPSVAEPAPPTKPNETPSKDAASKDTPLDKMAKRESVTPSPPQEQKDSETVASVDKTRRKQDQVRLRPDVPAAELPKPAGDLTASAGQKLSASSERAPMPSSPGAAAPGATVPSIGARALFYGGEPERADTRAMAQEQEGAMKPLAEFTPQGNQPERKTDRRPAAGKAAGVTTPLKPLGLRYSFVVRSPDGLEQEVDAPIAAQNQTSMLFTVEANQDGYVQIWRTVQSSTPQLLFPDKATGQISIKIGAGRQRQILLPEAGERCILTVRFSRVPFGPITRQEAALLDRPLPDQLQESISPEYPTGSQEHAVYVVNPEPAQSQLSIPIPFGLPD